MKNEELIQNVGLGKVFKVKELLTLKMDPNLKDETGDSLLHIATLKNRYKIVVLLLEAGAKVNLKNRSKKTPLSLFVTFSRSKDDKIPKALIEAGANVNLKYSKKSWSPLHYAVDKNWPELVMKILEYGGNINENENKYNYSPLHITRSREIGEILIDNGAHINKVNKDGFSPFETALSAISFSEEVVSSDKKRLIEFCMLLIEKGADCNKVDLQGRSVLMDALSRKLFELCYLLIDKGAHLDYTHDQLGSVIHFSSSQDCPDILTKILNSGVDPNLISRKNGYTPLHYAVANNCKENVRVLIKKGGDPSIKNNDDQTSIGFAQDREDLEMLKLLGK
jgi:ankyrin repeat protein